MITPTSGRANAHSSAICPNPRIASSRMQISVSSSRRQSVNGTPISLLKLRSAATVRACGAADRREDILRRRLPHRAGDRDDARGRAVADRARERGERGVRIAREEHRRRRHARTRACRSRRRADRDEEIAFLDAPGVDLDAGDLVGPGRSREFAGSEAGEMSSESGITPASARGERRARPPGRRRDA